MKYLYSRWLSRLGALCTLALLIFSAEAAETVVTIRDFAFSPAQVTIQVGDSVIWLQRDGTQHTTTSGASGSPDGMWDSPLLSLNQTFTNTFTAAGTFSYFCRPHAFMTGSVTVEGGQATPLAVAITSPTNNTVLAAPGPVTFEVTVTPAATNVASVEFFDGGTSLGIATNSPFSLTTDLAAGSHQVTARATDSSGASATSEPVTITVSGGGGPVSVPIEDPLTNRIAKGDYRIELEVVASGLISPLGMAAPDDGSGRFFVYDQAGLVHVISNGARLESPLLDVSARLVAFAPGDYDERGLLGLAAHPNFAQNPLIYTYTSEPVAGAATFPSVLPAGATNDHQSVIAEWRIDPANTNRVDPASRREIMRVDKPQANHNGGTIRFGPDGFLYISIGDGGAADDQGPGHSEEGNGQDDENILGDLVRIDVDARTSSNSQYGVPADNPFLTEEELDEIWAYGFRNPYNFSFDMLTGDLYLADVGQNKVEELDIVTKGGNYGWPIREGTFYFDPNGTNDGFVTSIPVREVPPDLINPIAEYDHDDGSAVVGGFVYRGSSVTSLSGRYINGDWGSFEGPSGRLFYLDHGEFKELRIGRDDRPFGLWLKGFGQDLQGEMYLFGSTNLGPQGTSGQMLKIVPLTNTLEIVELSMSATNLSLTLTNTFGPSLLQVTENVAKPIWRTIAGTTNNVALAPLDQTNGFIRAVDSAGNYPLPFTASLSGAAERPDPITNSTATGSGTFSLEGDTLHFNVQYSDLSGLATAAHIHGPARATGAAPVMVNLAPFNGGAFGTNGTLAGSVALTSEQKSYLLEGRTYVNVHTGDNPGGEIRGQLAPVAFAAAVSGSSERPPVDSPAVGSGSFLLVGNSLTFNVTYRNLTGVASAAHIHGPAPLDQSAPVIVPLQSFNGGAFGSNGVLSGNVTLTPDQLGFLVDGLTYVNFHTELHGSGEIRGQVLPQSTAIPLSASLSGAAEVPDKIQTAATGSGIFILDGNHLQFDIAYQGLSGTAVAAHIHGPAKTTEPAPVIISLEPGNGGAFGSNGTLSGSVEVTPEQRKWLLEGRTYANVHTGDHPGGEIRGQIAPALMQAILSGASEQPLPIQTDARGTAQFLLAANQLYLNASYSGLSSTASAAHIHGPASRSEAVGVLVGLQTNHIGPFSVSGAFAGPVLLPPEVLGNVIDQRTYLNIHSLTNAGGEIRGQIVR